MFLELCLRMPYPAIMIHIGIDRHYLQLPPILPESLRIPVRPDPAVISDHTNLMRVPCPGIADIIITPIKMQVFKKQPFHARVLPEAGHRFPDRLVIPLMDDLVSLQIKTPVGSFGDPVKCFIGFNSQYLTALLERIIPNRRKDLYFV